MAIRFNPFKSAKHHGASWVGPSGSEEFYRGQELIDCTAQEDFKELEKRVIFEQEGFTTLSVNNGPAPLSVAAAEAERAPLLTTPSPSKGKTKQLPIEGQAIDKKKLDAKDFVKLPRQQRRAAIARVLDNDAVDSDAFLDKIRERLDLVGVKPQPVEIRFRDLKVHTTYTYAGGAKFGKKLIRKLDQTERLDDWIKAPLPQTEERRFHALRGCSGVLRAGRLTLLLGPPGSGKSTLMQVLSGKFDQKDFTVEGELLFNGREPGKDFDLESSALYIDQDDAHFPELTVRETLALASSAQGMGKNSGGLLGEVEARERALGIEPDPEMQSYYEAIKADAAAKGTNPSVEAKLYLFNLHGCADTMVGNELLRGITGAQRKALTLAEATAGPVRVVLLDEPVGGLDAEGEAEAMRTLKRAAEFMPLTVLIAHSQPSAEVFNMFDDVMLMSDGYILYHGPREDVLPFFESQGLRPPAESDPVDFLNQVAIREFQEEYSTRGEGWEYIRSRELAAAFAGTALGKSQSARLSGPWEPKPPRSKSAANNPDFNPLVEARYGGRNGLARQAAALTRREWILFKRSPMLVCTRWLMTFATAIIVSLTWWRTPARLLEKGVNFAGLLWFTVVREYTAHFAETAIFNSQLPTFFKHRDNMLYPAWLASLVSGILYAGIVSFVDATIYTLPVYWLAGLAGTFGHFFVFWMMLWWTGWLGILTFRIFTALGRKMVAAQYYTTLWLILCINTMGYLIHKDKIRGWLIWAYWMNPLTWLYRAFMINEFTAGRWAYLYPYPWTKHEAPGSAPAYSQTTGRAVLRKMFFQDDKWFIWVGGWAFVWGFILLFLGALALIMQTIKPRRKPLSIPSDIDSQRDFERYAAIKSGQAAERSEKASQHGSAEAASVEAVGDRGTSAGEEAEGEGEAPGTIPAVVPGRQDSSTPAADGDGAATADAATAADGVGAAAAGGDAKPRKTMAEYLQGAKARVPESVTTSVNKGMSRVKAVQMPEAVKKRLPKKQPKKDPFADLGAMTEKPVLPFTPVTLTFKGVSYSVPKFNSNKKEEQRTYLLRDLTGLFRPRTITAIMGDVGSGKKLAMDVLAQQPAVPGGELEGNMHVNGYSLDAAGLQLISGYLEQIDALPPYSTVRECVQHAASTRLPKELALGIVNSHVEQVMRLCELSDLADMQVGIPCEKGLSPEQRRRVSIACELSGNPSVLFCEEPTTRMEARDAAIVMDLLRRIADTGRTVVCTLHQPRPEVFAMCDDLLLLKPGGRPIYFGALGEDGSYVTEYFESIDGVPPLSPDDNPAGWMMRVSSADRELDLNADLYDVYKGSELYRNILEVVDEHHVPQPGGYPVRARPKGMSVYSISPFAQFVQLLRVRFHGSYRDARYNGIRFAYTITTALMLGLLWWNQGNNRNTTNGIMQIFGATFSATLFMGVQNAVAAMQPAAWQRVTMTQDRGVSRGMHALAQAVNEGCWTLVQAVIFTVPFYWMLSLYADVGKFLLYIWFFWLTFWYFSLLGTSFTNLFRSLPAATCAMVFLIISWAITAGYMIPRPQLPGWAVWYYWINPLAWSNYGLVGSQLANIDRAYTFWESGLVTSVSSAVLKIYGFHHWISVALATLMLWLAVIGFTLLSYGATRWVNHQKAYSYKYIA